MVIKIVKWLRGYLRVSIKGYSPERFINLCRNKNILIWDLCQTEEGYEFYITLPGFWKIRPIVKKTRTRPIVRNRFGGPFFLQRCKKRKGFIIGVLLGFSILYILSLYIWDITLQGQYTYTEDKIEKYLKEIHVYAGMKKQEVDCQWIEESIRKQYTDIGWVSVELKGTRLNIKITETNMPPEKEIQKEESHIVASHDGIVTDIVTRKGTPLVGKGDVVKKGDILISGIVPITGDGDVLLRNDIVAADGDVILKTNYSYKDSFPLAYEKKSYTGEEITEYGIEIVGKYLFWKNPLKHFDTESKYDIIVNEKNIILGTDFALPIIVRTKQYKECNIQEAVYTEEEAITIAGEHLSRYFDKLIEKGVSIQENNVKIEVTNQNCIAAGKLIVEEKQQERRKIQDSEWRSLETDEYSGTDY